jgi:formylglycine-generating enzyme required for sulfatase activity
MPKSPWFVHLAARWLDRQPLLLVVAVGMVLGLGIGLPGFVSLRAPAWVLFWGVLFVALWRIGHSAEPVFEEESPAVARPKWVRDGPLVMMELPGGSFHMGSPDADDMAYENEKPSHLVTVSGLRIAVTPVTAGLYAEVMQRQEPPEDQRQLPAVDVYWSDAIEFCNRLSTREAYRPCYRRYFGRWICNWRADGYRLPTEAEWEYACRAGTTTRYSCGDDSERLERYAWFDKTGGPYEVARKLPNPWGLYDMHGNVWEWCWDWYGPYTAQPAKDPHGPKKFLSARAWGRVVRGGSFVSPEALRSAFRFFGLPERRGWYRGFRCVRVPPPAY